jgi:hypothetical protein
VTAIAKANEQTLASVVKLLDSLIPIPAAYH